MKTTIDEQLDALLSDLKNQHGNSMPADLTPQLQELLSVARIGASIPVHQIPQPTKRYKFKLIEQHHSAWSKTFLQIMAASFAILMVISVGAWISVPGKPLFLVKKTMEQARLELARNPEQKATLQLSLVEKRIREAQTILSSNSTDENSKAAALNELASQTKSAADTVKKVTIEKEKQDPTATPDNQLINSLDNLAKRQEALLATIPQDETMADADEDNLEEPKEKTKTALAEVRHILATVNEQTLAEIPTTVSSSGPILSITASKITVEDNIFSITTETNIFAADGTTGLKITALAEKINVRVEGKGKPGELTAISIFLLEDPIVKPDVKGQTTTTPKTESVTPTPIPTEDPNQAQAGFIYEDPAPAYAP